MPDLSGTHGLIVGVANKRSISWAIAQAAGAAGARIAMTYPSERLEENVRELAAKLENSLVLPCDVTSDQQIAGLAVTLGREFGGLDFFLHGAAFAPATELDNPFVAAGISGFSNILQVYRDRAPLKRDVEVAEVADAATFLLSVAARAITGEILMVDAGFHVSGGI